MEWEADLWRLRTVDLLSWLLDFPLCLVLLLLTGLPVTASVQTSFLIIIIHLLLLAGRIPELASFWFGQKVLLLLLLLALLYEAPLLPG